MNELQTAIVTAEEMRQIEERIFTAGMPVAALMEKVAGLIAAEIVKLYPLSQVSRVGIVVGPGHNGGDALVVARELHLQGYQVKVFRPFAKLKALTEAHAKYAASLGIPFSDQIESLQACDLIVDGLFGFGLTRSLSGQIAQAVALLNQGSKPIVSIDLPSGIHTNTGAVLGTAVRATRTFCLGLWKRAFFQEAAIAYCGKSRLLEFGIPAADVRAILSENPPVQRMTRDLALQSLPLPRSPITHKYQQGHLLLIGGSRRYAGSIILAALGARASGVGMLSVAVPESLKPLLMSHLPEALIVGCPETGTGAISQLPDSITDFAQFSAIACGCGLTLEAQAVVEAILSAPSPLILDADGLNILAQRGTLSTLSQRSQATLLTPHLGEFKRLFPHINSSDRIAAVQTAAAESGTIILLKGARTAIAPPTGPTWLIADSTPALARGGSGDVLAGLVGGLVAQGSQTQLALTGAIAAWWHAQAGLLAAIERTELGVDAFTLSQYLIPALRSGTSFASDAKT